MPIAPDVLLGARVAIPRPELVNLYGCTIGDDTMVGPFVEIQKGVTVGRACKISSHSFLCTGLAGGLAFPTNRADDRPLGRVGSSFEQHHLFGARFRLGNSITRRSSPERSNQP